MVKKIYWDKCHRNSAADFGASGNGLRESDLGNKIVDYAMAYLNANYTDFEQTTSRTNDQVMSLQARTDKANAWGAHVYLSPHINAGGGRGFESYIYNNTGASTIALQNVMHNEILSAMRGFGEITDRGKKRNNFHVLRESHMDALLTENLFIDTADANHLKNEAFIKAVGEAHGRGVAKYLGLPGKPAPHPAPTPKPSAPSAQRRVKIVNVNAAAIMMDKPDRINGANIGTIPKGKTVDMIVPVAGYNNGTTGYYKIVYGGKTGYINASMGQEV